jgi:hypothetical protein
MEAHRMSEEVKKKNTKYWCEVFSPIVLLSFLNIVKGTGGQPHILLNK